MAAKDYKICPAVDKAYIAKESKRRQGTMTTDRREIPESEIVALIEWFTKKYCIATKADTFTLKVGGNDLFTIAAKGRLLDEVTTEVKRKLEEENATEATV